MWLCYLYYFVLFLQKSTTWSFKKHIKFAALGGVLILNDKVPEFFGVFGIILVVLGMVLNSLSREKAL